MVWFINQTIKFTSNNIQYTRQFCFLEVVVTRGEIFFSIKLNKLDLFQYGMGTD